MSGSFWMIVLLLLATNSYAQFTQRIRGTIVDQVLQKPIIGATVSLPLYGKTVVTDSTGSFRFSDVPVGIQKLMISNIGFKDLALDNLVVNAGKELVLTIAMEGQVHTENEVIVKANSRKNKPLNDMSSVSARAFTVEETQKYAAAVNDPLRMATGFPGVMAADDGNNHIIIRGNTPTGLLWKMEGVDIPNPNHFSSAGATGGGISILNAQLLANSDFVTGAFAPEYGNGLSGVFDLKLRKGNNEKKEYTVQAGFLGLNAAAEGPFLPNYKGSYLINYRYSTLSLIDKMGIDVSSGSTNFQDLSYNIYLPTKWYGNFSFFGFGGLSSDRGIAEKDSTKWKDNDLRYDSKF
ncbi:MAG TPA: carboxypeptidase regulatory-like domain-containing protein, partial [Chitinophagaceae bacterium]|nr:carboxypeptidase regulatory-like domain-containing protein [Chitinophagaceae bacterium]